MNRKPIRPLLRSCAGVTGADLSVSILAVALAGPFVSTPALMVTTLVLFQLIAMAAARLSTSESLHRSKNEYLKDTFSRYVPAHIAETLAENGEEIKLGGEQREITVLFCDIRGFTKWSESVDPEEVISQLNVLLRGLSAAVLETGGTLDKYTGDGLMAFWGAPLEQPAHAELAVTAAIEMLERLVGVNGQRQEEGLPPFAIGIGVHSGRAVVGNIGHEERLDYTAIGDTVNTSARLEAATKDVGSALLLSRATWDLLPTMRQRLCLRIGGIRVKGKAQPIDVFAVSHGEPTALKEQWQEAALGIDPDADEQVA